MNEVEQHDPVLEGEQDRAPQGDNPPTGGNLPTSIIDQLRQQHGEMLATTSVDMPIPGWTNLHVRYRILDVENELNPIGRRVRQEQKDGNMQALVGGMDTMITACIGFFWEVDGKMMDLAGSIGPDEPPICYDERLVEWLWSPKLSEAGHHKPSTARDVVRLVFGWNEPAILNHSMRLATWMNNTKTNVNRDFLGEG